MKQRIASLVLNLHKIQSFCFLFQKGFQSAGARTFNYFNELLNLLVL